jgi:hypothetical protein
VQAAHGVEDESCEYYVEAKVEVGRARSDRAQLAIPDHPGEPLLQLRPHLGMGFSSVSLGKHLVMVDAKHEDRRDDEAERVGEDRVRRGDCRDQSPGHARAGNLCNRTRQIELRVAVDHVLAFDERWEVRLVADVEEDGEASDEELQREKVPDAQRADCPENRDQHEED